MVNATPATCTACRKTSPAGEAARMLVCSRCQTKAKRQIAYCSRDCQVSHYPTHKPFCGIPTPTASAFASVSLDPSSAFQPPPALLFHLAALSQLPPPAFPDATPPPSFLYFPSTPVPTEGSSSADPPMPVPISLPDAARNLFNALQFTAFRTGNPLAVNLMYSLLLTEIEALGGVEDRLVEQLSEEYRLDGEQELVAGEGKRPSLKQMLEEEEEPTGEDLMAAIGGEENMGMLLEWQMSEADRQR
ncbi:hypothetical protein JCM6882_001338 [Rhodosporidiobolus microsporus]